MIKSLLNLKAGERVGLSYGSKPTPTQMMVTFLGFTNWNTAYSKTPVFKSWAEVKENLPVRSFKHLQEQQDRREHGYEVYAIFRDDEGNEFGAYLFEGRWSVCSGAHRISLIDEEMMAGFEATGAGRTVAAMAQEEQDPWADAARLYS